MITDTPSVFIGSSTESLNVAFSLQSNIEYDCDPTVWTQEFFNASSFALIDLVSKLDNFDFAVFVFSPDDVLTMRGNSAKSVRDNVVFELGLFIGRLGLERCFILQPRDSDDMHLPTDLLGWQPLRYKSGRNDGNMSAALGPSAQHLRGVFSRIGRRRLSGASVSIADRTRLLTRYANLWESDVLSSARSHLNSGIVGWIGDDEKGHDTEALLRVRAFLESVCDASIRGELDTKAVEAQFGQAIRAVNNHSRHYFMMPNSEGDNWKSPMEVWLSNAKN
jgi:Predicted nucleotide-binding protein containing TIR-like domain